MTDSEARKEDWRALPRGGVIPKATGEQYHTGDWRSSRPLWIPENCIHCLLCWVYCPDMAVIVEDGKMIGFDLEHCKGCGICAWECPTKDKAIEMRPETDWAPTGGEKH